MKIDRRLERSKRTRKNLLNSAKTVFLQLGYHQTTITKINETAETGHGTFYAHFPKGKDEILSVLMQEIMNEFHQITAITFEPNTRDEAFSINHHQVLQFISLAEKHKDLLAVFYEAIGASSLLKSQWEDFLAQFLQRITEDIQYAIDRNLAKDGLDQEIVARMLLFSGEHFLWEIVRGNNTKPVETIADNLTKVYMFGLYR